MIAHTMGIPSTRRGPGTLCRQRGLWLIEDCCDALGTTLHGRHVGTFGDLATLRSILPITSPSAKAAPW